MPEFHVITRKLDRSIDPEAAFLRCFAGEPGAFWLDSSLADGRAGRWSFLGAATGPLSEIVRYSVEENAVSVVDRDGERRHAVDVLTYLDSTLRRRSCASPELPFDFNGGFVGWLGYELKADCGAARRHRAPTADAAFVFADRIVAVDGVRGDAYLSCVIEDRRSDTAAAEAWFDAMEARLPDTTAPDLDKPAPHPVAVRLHTPYRRYLADIGSCLDHIRAGESYELCLTHRIDVDGVRDALGVYRRLRRGNPAPYGAYLDIGGTRVLCSSPERFLRVTRDRCVESKPIKGTAPRDADGLADEALKTALQGSEKDRAENLMIVDLLRNDLGRVCEVGSVHVPVLMGIETFPSVHQMVSTVRGKLRESMSVVDCVRASFPGGSMTGAPKLRTMSILDDLEPAARGIYSGSIGYLALNGTTDLNIVIRTLVEHDGRCSLGVGGAIVALSDPEAEFEETLVKARASLRAVLESAGAGRGDEIQAAIGAALRSHGCFRFDPCEAPT